MVVYTGSAICIVHADVTLTRSKVKVKVTRRWLLAPFRGDFYAKDLGEIRLELQTIVWLIGIV